MGTPTDAGTDTGTMRPPCMRCSREADFDVLGLWLCIDCYHIAGSTCSGVERPRAAADSSSESSAGGKPQVTPLEGVVGGVC